MKLKDGCFSDLAATIAENFNIFKIGNGKSFFKFYYLKNLNKGDFLKYNEYTYWSKRKSNFG